MPVDEPFDLRPENATTYLRQRGVLDAREAGLARADSLGGGVSNAVIRVVVDDRCFVLKQPLPDLAVAEDWPADVSRVHNEAAAARAYATVAREAGFDTVRVPGIVAEDERSHVVVMECAPAAATMWKAALLDGRVDSEVARTLGSVLGAVHRRAAGDPDLRARFDDLTPFEQLRVDPYHRTTAERHPDLAEPILAEADRVLETRTTLVHGDYSPKNVLVDRSASVASADGTDGGEPTLWLLDFEVAHWGDPAFDTGFMCNHLFIKSVHNRTQRDEYIGAARAFWNAYDSAVEWDVETETVRELAVLMLARVDGKSPVEYANEDTRERLREVARRALREGTETIDGYAALVREVA